LNVRSIPVWRRIVSQKHSNTLIYLLCEEGSAKKFQVARYLLHVFLAQGLRTAFAEQIQVPCRRRRDTSLALRSRKHGAMGTEGCELKLSISVQRKPAIARKACRATDGAAGGDRDAKKLRPWIEAVVDSTDGRGRSGAVFDVGGVNEVVGGVEKKSEALDLASQKRAATLHHFDPKGKVKPITALFTIVGKNRISRHKSRFGWQDILTASLQLLFPVSRTLSCNTTVYIVRRDHEVAILHSVPCDTRTSSTVFPLAL
jgi:hypothetical protein